MNYSDEIRIDEDALYLEWLDQSSKMLKITKVAAKLKAEMDDAKDALDLERSTLDYKIRQNPEKYIKSSVKITETVISNAILQQSSYRDANKRYLKAKYENEVAKGAVEAFEQRKSALENLVRLHGQQYFAGPRVPRDIHSERELKEKRLNKKIKLKRRRNT